MTARRRTVAIVESTVMGRSAVAVVIAAVQIPAFAQLAGVDASQSVTQAGPSALPLIWALALIASGLLMGASYVLRDNADRRVLEIAACALIVIGSTVYAIAVVESAGAVGALWLLSIVGALAVNCLGYAVLLVRQIMFVARVERRIREESDL